MPDAALQTLLQVLQEKRPLLDEAKEILFQRARLDERLRPWISKLRCVQTFKPHAEELRASSFDVRLQSQEPASVCLYLPTPQKEENLFHFADCMNSLEEGGTLFSSMENHFGAARFEKELRKLAGNIESYSKNKCRVFWTTRTASLDQSLMNDWLARGRNQLVEGTQFHTHPGIFGWNKIDRGSAFLCEHLPRELNGRGADVGSGYGFLSHFILENCEGVQSLALYEAESLALDAARLNLEKVRRGVEISFHWHDVRGGLDAQNLDWIVMNPPFHDDGASDVELGQNFITSAAEALRPGGELHLVANLRLPYEKILKENFQEVDCRFQGSGFKVYSARK